MKFDALFFVSDVKWLCQENTVLKYPIVIMVSVIHDTIIALCYVACHIYVVELGTGINTRTSVNCLNSSWNITYFSVLCQMELSLEYSSSGEDFEAQPCSFNIEDLPSLHIPSPFQSDSSGCETPTSPAIYVTSRPGISSQTSDGVSATPKNTRGKKYVKKKSGRFKKGQQQPRSIPIIDSPHAKRHKVERPQTAMFTDMRFPTPAGTYQVKTGSGDKAKTLDLIIPTGNSICNLEILSLVFTQLNCIDRSCYGRLKLYERLIQDGLQRFLLLKCTHCHNVVAEFPATLPIGVSALDSINNKSVRVKGQSEINKRALMAVHTTSASWEDFRLTCSLLDLKPPNRDMSKSQLNNLMAASVTLAKRSMKFAGDNAYLHASEVDDSPSGLRECAVSFDASWHQRGHCSNQGFAAAIDTDFGKVLDYSLYDRVCYSCSKWPESRRSSCPDEFEEYWSAHKNLCTANYKGTSQAMESTAAIDVWRRSIETHNLAYGTYIGDGDSSSFKNLLESDPYSGQVFIRKEECIGHAQKRLKKSLMKKVAGSTCLSQSKADRIAHLYALVVVQNRGQSASEIREGLQVLLSHTKEVHDHCPPGEGSWCYYQKKVSLYESDGGDAPPQTREPYLSPAEFARAVEVFKVFGSLSFCSRITMGKTQNSNESLHNMLWHNSPKSKHVGQKSLTASTALAVLSFNDGSLSYSRVMEELGLTISHHTLLYLSRRDRLRNLAKARRVKETQKRRRRQMTQTLVAESSRRRSDKKVYSSGHFGSEMLASSEESDTVCSSCKSRHCPLITKSKKDSWISCEGCEDWFHWACAGVKSKRLLPEYYFCNRCNT